MGMFFPAIVWLSLFFFPCFLGNEESDSEFSSSRKTVNKEPTELDRYQDESKARDYWRRLFDRQKLWGTLAETILNQLETLSMSSPKKTKGSWLELPSSLAPGSLESSETKQYKVVALTSHGQHPRALTVHPDDTSGSLGSLPALGNDDPYIGIIFDIYHYNEDESDLPSIAPYKQSDETCGSAKATCGANFAVRYQLMEPLHMQLGSTVKHVIDFAYTPVMADQVEPVVAHQQSEHSPAKVSRTDGRRMTNKESDIASAPLSGPGPARSSSRDWWQWWIPWWSWDGSQDHYSNYRMNNFAFAGGSHGEVWRGRRRCCEGTEQEKCNETLIFKRLKIENGFRILEAGLREVYFGRWLSAQAQDVANMYTRYVDHFFREQNHALELWIVFENAGPSLRSFIYTGHLYGDFVVYQHSLLWTKLRASVAINQSTALSPIGAEGFESQISPGIGKFLMREVLRNLVEAAAYLHNHGVVHRDIKPSNIMCMTNIELDGIQVIIPEQPKVSCVLGDFSSAWNVYSGESLYTGGASRLEQTDEYAPPEAIFGGYYKSVLGPAFDSWSIGIVALELLLGTPNVFTVDQRTKTVLTQRMKYSGASEDEIERALYLAALSQFCIFDQKPDEWPLRHGDPLHKLKMTKESCTINDFKRALHARDPLGIGFDASVDTLLQLIWQLLAYDPKTRMTASDALHHPYFEQSAVLSQLDSIAGDHNAIESQMLDPRMDIQFGSAVNDFVCPKCGRHFQDWYSCLQHARGRKHANFCSYEKRSIPTCLNAHTMLPTHPTSGHCDIKGRRKVIEDFHAIHLLPDQQFYGIFDGHGGNRASKYATSFLFNALARRLQPLESDELQGKTRDEYIIKQTSAAFHDIHAEFLRASSGDFEMDQSGTTATVMLVRKQFVLIASLGDSRAVLSTKSDGKLGAIQITNDHIAANPDERQSVEERGGFVKVLNGVARVNGNLVVTRSIGDQALSKYLSRTPDVFPFSKEKLRDECGALKNDPTVPCFVILASDGLWDVIDNQEAVLMVAEIVSSLSPKMSWRENSSLQHAAEALVHEAYVRGSSDNIGVCVVALEV